MPIKVPGYDFYTSVGNIENISRLKKDVAYNQSSVDINSIDEILAGYDFTKKVIDPGEGYSMSINYYTHKDVVCEVYVTETYNNPTGDHHVTVACADMTDYRSIAEQQKPFFAVYPKVTTGNGEEVLMIGKPDIKSSKTEGYALANLGVGSVASGEFVPGSAAGLFYKTPDGKWHFFKGTQSALLCSEYNTDDLKKAYLGESCELDGSNTSSQVKL